MYNIYQTEGMILGGTNQREANRFFYIFSENFGLLRATAQSVREVKSKLRYGLQDFSLSQFALARGKGAWRITNVACHGNLYYALRAEKEKLRIVARLASLLKQLLPNEIENKNLYQIVRTAVSFLETTSLTAENIEDFEKIILLRILRDLGYFNETKPISKQETYGVFFNNINWDLALLDKMNPIKRQAILDINDALNATHLLF